VLRTTGLN